MEERAETALMADPTVKRALSIVLMREVLPLLDALGEKIAAGHLQMAIDAVLGASLDEPPRGSC